MRLLRFSIPAMVWAVIVMVLSLLPGNSFAPPPPLFGIIPVDVAGHLFCYIVLAFFLMLAYTKQQAWPKFKHFSGAYAIGTAFVYGLVIELLQEYVASNRTFEVHDVFANTFGGVIGVGIFKGIFRLFKPKKEAA